MTSKHNPAANQSLVPARLTAAVAVFSLGGDAAKLAECLNAVTL
jgi:hypothetical protein